MKIIAHYSDGGTWPKDSDSLIHRVVEELWQKGYDLKLSETGWVVREPLGSHHVSFASDSDLIDYAAGRTSHTPPQSLSVEDSEKQGVLSSSASSSCVNSSSSLAPTSCEVSKDIDDSETVLLASVQQDKIAVKLVLGCFILGFLLTANGIFFKSLNFQSEEVDPVLATTQGTGGADPAANVAISQKSTVQKSLTVDDESNQFRLAAANSSNSGVRVSEVDDWNSASKVCIAQLEERFSARAPVLIHSQKNQPGETCYFIDGRDYCPYHSRGQAIFLYVDAADANAKTYACDVNIANMSIGNLRVVKADPGIVKFLVSEASLFR